MIDRILKKFCMFERLPISSDAVHQHFIHRYCNQPDDKILLILNSNDIDLNFQICITKVHTSFSYKHDNGHTSSTYVYYNEEDIIYKIESRINKTIEIKNWYKKENRKLKLERITNG